jgi:RNA polymerase sigma-70 factor (ECF subfamily)
MRRDTPTAAERPVPSHPGGTVVRLAPTHRGDEEIVRGAQAREPWAAAALLDRHGPMVERIIRRILGHDPELEDLVHDAFATTLASIHQVRDGEAVKGWMAAIAAHTAHHAIRRRQTSRFLLFWKRQETALQAEGPSSEPRDALRRAYEVLGEMPADDRVAFALRFLEEMELADVAATMGLSVSTVKRRLARAEKRFLAAAERCPVLRRWMEEGGRWSPR